MMLKLNFEIPPSKKKIDLKDSIYLSGSCFSDTIGSRLSENKLNTLSNPFGTLYNPYSILKTLRGDFAEKSLINSHGIFYHWDTHSCISALTAEDTLNQLNTASGTSQSFLKKTDWLILTFGTAHVYQLKENHQIVANCHKVPQTSFSKRLLSHTEIITAFNDCYSYLRQVNPHINILLTVSPVRHVRDGLVENNRSKAVLLSAVHTLCDSHENVSYFPSYEIAIDELRDYRFYAEDMIHPSTQAVSYIWEKFAATYFNDATLSFLKQWHTLRSMLRHRPFQPQSQPHQQMLRRALSKLEALSDQVDVTYEIQTIKNQIL